MIDVQYTSAASSPEPTQTLADDLIYALRFDLLRNMRYHGSREAWFSRWHKAAMFAAAFAGTAAGAQILVETNTVCGKAIAAIAAFAVAFITTLDLVSDLDGAARRHAGFRQRFAAILADVEAERPLPSEIPKYRGLMARLYGEEPPTLNIVDAVVWNDTYRAFKQHVSVGELIPISWWQRAIRHLFIAGNFDSRTKNERVADNTLK